jgi:hypothetical protein
MSEAKTVMRTRLTHAQYHQVCLYMTAAATPDTKDIPITTAEMVLEVGQHLSIECTVKQVREMAEMLGLSIVHEGGAGAARSALQIQLGILSDVVAKQLDENITLMESVKALIQQTGEHAEAIEKIKMVLNDQAKELHKWAPVPA